MAGDCSASVLIAGAQWSNSIRELAVHPAICVATGAEDDCVSISVPIIIHQQRHDRKQCFLKVSDFQTDHLNWLEPTHSFRCR